MMARIRSVHPNLFTNEAWVSCSPLARILLIGLWTDADDQGVFEWKPLQLKMRLLPGDMIDAVALLDELATAGLIRGFSAEGRNYGAIKDFQKWQRPKKPRAVYPMPDDLVPYLTGEAEPEPDLFGAQVPPLGGTGGEIRPQREEGGGNRRMESESEGARGRRKPEVPIPEGFPDTEAIAKASDQASSAGVFLDIERQAARFRGHAETNDRRCRDWRAAFRTWVDKAIETAPRLVAAEMRQEVDPDQARFWMRHWIDKPHLWKRGDRGPAPDEKGCRIPLEIMNEFGYLPPGERAVR